jgi:TubC N-terminal docking domain
MRPGRAARWPRPHVLRALRARGVTLSVDGGRLKITAPEPLPDEVMELLRTHKAEIMAALGDQATEARNCLPPVHDARDPHAVPRPRTATELAASLPQAPCHGSCGRQTPYGWECLSCRTAVGGSA